MTRQTEAQTEFHGPGQVETGLAAAATGVDIFGQGFHNMHDGAADFGIDGGIGVGAAFITLGLAHAIKNRGPVVRGLYAWGAPLVAGGAAFGNSLLSDGPKNVFEGVHSVARAAASFFIAKALVDNWIKD